MAASSLATSNNSTGTPPSRTAIITTTNASKNLRGLNKPKCIKCGNVARSRCPYQSCKSCCAKAQNPCHIHVLKASSSASDKTPSSSSSLFDQHSNEASPSGNSQRFTSLRQLSHNFSQFNNLQSPLRSRKPLSRKDAAVINEWRFLKLQEYKEGNIEVENEAFDRYMQNVSLLKELLAVASTAEGPTTFESALLSHNRTCVDDHNETEVAGVKTKLRPNHVRTENLRKRVKDIVDQGLRKLRKIDLDSGGSDLNKQDELVRKEEKGKSWHAVRASAFNDLLDKLNKARTVEDLKSCLEMKAQLFDQNRARQTDAEGIQASKNKISPRPQSDYSPPKWFSSTNIDQDALNRVDVNFFSLEQIETL